MPESRLTNFKMKVEKKLNEVGHQRGVWENDNRDLGGTQDVSALNP